MKDLLGASLLFIPRLLTGSFSEGRKILKCAPNSFQMKVIGPWAKETPFVRLSTPDSSILIYFDKDVLPFEWDELVTLEKSRSLLGVLDPYWNFIVHADPLLKHFQAVNDPKESLILVTEGEQESWYDKVSAEVERALHKG